MDTTSLHRLELEETESANVNDQVYIQLLVHYLYQNELIEAKYLWRRIPEKLKENAELRQLHILMNSLLVNNTVDFFQALKFPWSESIKSIISDLEAKIRKEMFQLVQQSYASIFEVELLKMLGLTREQLRAECNIINWTYEDDQDPENPTITPKRPQYHSGIGVSSENQLLKLTEFVSFLEN